MVALAIDQSHPLVDLAFACVTSDRWLRRKGMGYHSATDLTAGAPHLAGQLQSPSLASSSTSYPRRLLCRQRLWAKDLSPNAPLGLVAFIRVVDITLLATCILGEGIHRPAAVSLRLTATATNLPAAPYRTGELCSMADACSWEYAGELPRN